MDSLLISQDLFDALLKEMGVGVLVIDPLRRIRLANKSVHKMLNARENSLIGRSLIEATLSYELVSLLAEAQEKSLVLQRELRKNETTGRLLSVRVIPIQQHSLSQPASCLLLLEDITDLRYLETVRRDFVANVSHELRTPLTSIRAIAETLQNGASSDPSVSARFLEIIIGEVERLTRLLQDLLTLSKAEQEGRSELSQFDLSPLIFNVVERFQSQAEIAGVQVKLINKEPRVVEASRDQIEQVVINLLDNAIKYTLPGGFVNISSSITQHWVTVELADSGIGVLSQDQVRLWERFYRADKARSRQSGGTGLGLSIVKHIVETHGGTVGVRSEYGHGSVFHFTLPVRNQSSTPSSLPPSS